MFKYSLLLLIALVTTCYCVNLEANDFMRRNVDNDEKECANIDSAKNIVRTLCEKMSYCMDAYVKNDDSCPKALWKYGTTGCRVACLKAINEKLNNHITGICIHSILRDFGWYCNERGNYNNLYECSSKRWKIGY